MYRYFIEKPAAYNLERAERISSSIYKSFKEEVNTPSLDLIKKFVGKYNEIPFLSVNFIYKNSEGVMKSILEDVKEMDILSAEYVYPIKFGQREVGTLLVYDINKEYKKGLEEYSHMLILTRVFFSIMLFLLFFIIFYREYSTKIENEKQIAEYQAVHDGLTGLYTQKYFKEHLANEMARSERYKHPVSLIMCDVDHFKGFNDTYGHLAGDEVLKTVSKIISENVRTSDVVARYGGEEFAILLVEATAKKDSHKKVIELADLREEALATAKRIKHRVANTQVKFDDKKVRITISMGISYYEGDPDYLISHLISEADLALYESKNNGRNRITVYSPETKEFTEYT